MSDITNTTAKKGGKKRMSGWLIALIVVVGLFLVGAICCNTIGKAQGDVKSPSTSASDTIKE